jgi:hypothetical protein
MAKNESRVTTAEKIETLIRIFRAAIHCRDRSLRIAAERNLLRFGIRASDLSVSDGGQSNDPA